MDLMELRARLTLDSSEYDQGLGRSEKSALSFGAKLKKGIGTVAKVGSIAMAGATAAYTYIGKKAFDAYASYEQLAGGVETLFGTGGLSLEEYAAKQGKSVDKVRAKYDLLQAGQSAVMENAAQAWKTTGLSMNDYMETVTGFSAALVRSTGGDTVSAAKYADMAMQDMSDNANKMGTDIGSIQAAYQGFAKQNYTMLDNLKLGYGGTKTEMQRLIKDANKLRKKMGLKPNLNIKNYKDILEAIHLIQEEMGIMGTTAREADTTIQGSVNAMKAAWSNLLLGIADDNQDFDALVSNFVTSFKTVSSNIMPRVKTILSGLGELFQAFADTILPEIINILVENAPQLAATAAQLIATLATALVKALPSLIRQIPVIITAIVGALKEAWPDIKQAGKDLLVELANGLGSDTGAGDGSPVGVMGTVVSAVVKKITEMLPKVKEAGKGIFNTLADGILEATSEYGNEGGAIGDNLELKGFTLLQRLGRWIKEVALPAVGGFFTDIWEGVKKYGGILLDGFWKSIVDGLYLLWVEVKFQVQNGWTAATEWISAEWESFTGLISGAWEWVKTSASGLWTSLTTGFSGAWESVKETTGTIWTSITTALSNAWERIKTTGSSWGSGIKTFFSNTWENIKTTTSEKWGNIKTAISDTWDAIKTNAGEKIETIKTAVSEKFDAVKETVKGTFETLKTDVGTIWEGIKEKISGFIQKIKDLFDFNWKFPDIKLPHIKVTEYMTVLGARIPKKFGIDWYKKAYETPYLFTSPTVVGNRGFGDGGGSGEMVYGRDALMRDIREAVGFGGGVTINVYQREGEDTMALSRRIEQDLLKIMQRGKAGALYV